MTTDSLHQFALDARQRAHAPYSGFRVGAAIVDELGNLHTGCNVENAAYPEGLCAEAGAIAAMVNGGGKTIREIVVVGGRDGPEPCSPCGGCRQRIREFANADTRISYVGADGELLACGIDQLLPDSFSL